MELVLDLGLKWSLILLYLNLGGANFTLLLLLLFPINTSLLLWFVKIGNNEVELDFEFETCLCSSVFSSVLDTPIPSLLCFPCSGPSQLLVQMFLDFLLLLVYKYRIVNVFLVSSWVTTFLSNQVYLTIVLNMWDLAVRGPSCCNPVENILLI